MKKDNFSRSFDRANDKVKDTVWTVVFVVIVILVAVIMWRVYKAAKAGTEAVGDIMGGAIIQKQTGITVARQAVCKDVAEKCHMAIHGDGGWFKIPDVSDRVDEDEEAVISNLNRLLTTAEAKYCSQIYPSFWGARNLKNDVQKYLDNGERARINTIILTNLQ